ncbi:hypothetical protein RUM43_004953 [Polyplax serrata]|uniref:OTU domain-containing protein n=1 Tax=Polyplax serrata TaxID=468196 RepID=A0AAN8XLY7_POLSC
MDDIYERFSIVGDGNCLFRAVSLYLYGTQEYHMMLRYKAVNYLREHWRDVKNHLVIDRERLRDEDRYCTEMETYGTHGTSVECFALSEILQRNVVIYLQGRSSSRIIRPKTRPIIISRRRYSQTIYLQLWGNPENGHFELLKPLLTE